MHDPTEGGLAAGLLEIAMGSGMGLMVDASRIPVLPESRVICDALGLDPFGMISSGALLVTLAPQEVDRLIRALEEEGIPACEIGQITTATEGLKLKTSSEVRELPVFERDEFARFLRTKD